MIRRLMCAAAFAALAVAPLACNENPVKNVSAATPNREVGRANVDNGPPLYAKKTNQVETPIARLIDPIPVPAHLTVIHKVDIPSQREGKIMAIGTELQPGEVVPESMIYSHYEPKTKQPVKYRPLVPGDRVEKGRMVVLLDDQEALAEYQAKVAGNEAAASAVLAAKATVKLLENLRDNTRLLYNNGKGTSEYEVHKAELDVVRAKAESEEKWALQIKAGSEMDKARVQLEMHHIRAPISGMLQPTNRKPGEGIRAQETLFQIQNTDLLQAEGTIPTGYRYQVKRNMEVIIEPSVEMAPRKRFVASAGRINGIAFSNHADPQIVVACEDKTAKVYSLAEVQLHVFAHDVAVRSVACTPAGVAAHLCLTGAEDGIGRLWDLDAKAVKGRDLEGHKHKGVITAVAFSPDAKTCATADSRDICLWDVATGKLKYVFPPQHLGEIQSLTFTPQAKLVSAARDNTLAVWSLGETGANLDYAVQGRSGDVARVGISHSGRYALFDIAQSLRVITLAEQLLKRQDVAELRSMTDAYKFATFAIYSPDDRLILTGTNTESRLSVWKAPTATSRATELRQFTPNDRVTLTCAAISPSEKHPFAVSGTKEGVVHVWPMPTESEIRAPIKGRITFVDNNADATARNFRVWAEFDNTQAQLPPGAAVTLVITPVEPAAPAK